MQSYIKLCMVEKGLALIFLKERIHTYMHTFYLLQKNSPSPSLRFSKFTQSRQLSIKGN